MNKLLTVVAVITFCLSAGGFAPQSFAQDGASPTPVAIQSAVRIGPENSRIEFVGTHVGDDPKPRLGGFGAFNGWIGVDLENQTITSIEVDMQIGSIWTEFDKLTAHLMNADFFEVDQFPTARFKSTRITTLQNGACNVAGELTLHGQTSDVMFPANFEFVDGGLVLSAQFILDRTHFGMDKMTDGVEKQVSISVSIGQPDRTSKAATDKSSSKTDESAKPEGPEVLVYLPKMT